MGQNSITPHQSPGGLAGFTYTCPSCGMTMTNAFRGELEQDVRRHHAYEAGKKARAANRRADLDPAKKARDLAALDPATRRRATATKPTSSRYYSASVVDPANTPPGRRHA